MAITLKAARVNAGLTQKEVATYLQISKATVASYEKYKTKPDIETAQKIAALYKMPIDGIIFSRKYCA